MRLAFESLLIVILHMVLRNYLQRQTLQNARGLGHMLNAHSLSISIPSLEVYTNLCQLRGQHIYNSLLRIQHILFSPNPPTYQTEKALIQKVLLLNEAVTFHILSSESALSVKSGSR